VENGGDGFLIGGLRGGEAGFVNAIVERFVDARVNRINLRPLG
jgi:hypothetical protein